MKKLKLYPIQEKIINECRDAMRYHKRIILMSPTGSGKTILSVFMIKQALKKNMRVMFICDRLSLINQTAKVFADYGLRFGVYQSDNPDFYPDRPVQLGSIQTLKNRDIQGEFNLFIFDEVATWYKTYEKIIAINQDSFILGLSASPFTSGLGKHFTKLVNPVSMKKMIEMKLLKEFDIYAPNPIDLSKVRIVGGEWKKDDLAEAADKPKLTADIVQTWLKLAKDRKTMVFSSGVPHGRSLLREFEKHGVKAVEVNGYDKKENTEDEIGVNQKIEDFRTGKVQVIISCEMLSKGFDVTSVSCCVFATSTKSKIKWLQAAGRGLRYHEGLKDCLILDHGSITEKLGFPDEITIDELDDGKHAESKNKKKEKPEKLPKVCPSCDFVKPPGVQKCPACGFKPEFVQDVEVEKGELEKLQRKTRKDYTLQEKQSFLAQLNQFASEKGFKEGKNGCYGWALHQYKEKFGSSVPSRLDWGKREQITKEVRGFITHLNIKKAKSKAPDKCFRCGSEIFTITQAGPHIKLSCAKCNKYMKFVNKDQENALRKAGKVA